MDAIDYRAQSRLLTIGRGHPYNRQAFHRLTQQLSGFDVSHVEHPAAELLLNARTAEHFAALLCYDMPGVDFFAADAPALVEPTEATKQGFQAMLQTGIGVVFLHHALAAWPAWDAYAEIIGGRFHYRAAQLRGKQWPDSGYRHGVTHQLSVCRKHPVTANLPGTFCMTDELYLCPVFSDEVMPLIESDYEFSDEHFYSAAEAVAGHMNSRTDWSHPDGCNVVGWFKHWGRSPIVYLQGGDDEVALDNPHFRQLVHNAVHWVSSAEAHTWAREQAAVEGP